MNETIDLMLNHTSVRRFTEEPIEAEHLQAIVSAGRAASSWKNFQSYSIYCGTVGGEKTGSLRFGAPASYLAGTGYFTFCGRP